MNKILTKAGACLLVLCALMASTAGIPGAAAQEEPPPLPKTYTTLSGVTFGYPEGWIVTEQMEGSYGMIELDSTAAADEKGFEAALDPGEVQIMIYTGLTELLFADAGLSADATPMQVMEMIVRESPYNFGQPSERAFGDKMVAYAEGSDFGFELMAFVGWLDDGTALVIQADTAPGERGSFEPTILAVVESIFGPASEGDAATTGIADEASPATETYVSKLDGFTLNYPSGWKAIQKGHRWLQLKSADDNAWVDIMWGALMDSLSSELGTDATLMQYIETEVIETWSETKNFGDPYEMTAGDKTVVAVDATPKVGTADETFMILELEDGTAVSIDTIVFDGEDPEPYMSALVQVIESMHMGDVPVFAPGETDTFVSEDTTFSFVYPADWRIEAGSDNSVSFDRGDEIVGDFSIMVEWGPADWVTVFAITEADTPMQVLEPLIERKAAYTDFGDPYETTAGDKTVAVVEGMFSETVPNLIAAFALGDGWFGTLDASIYQGELEEYMPALMDLIASAAAGPGPGEQTSAEAGEAAAGPSTGEQTACENVAVSIGDYSSEYSSGYTPAFLLDDDPTTGWSSAGGVEEPEFVVINLDGVQTVGGVLFNSYSPSSGYEADSIKDFSIETTGANGEPFVVFEGEAALQQGYQSYTFAPVQTDHLAFVFTSTHGGDYFEAADIMVCAAEAEVGGEEVRQWAVSASASSMYTDTNWSAMQATGEPDVSECGDIPQAWASSGPDVDWLRLEYEQPVAPTQVNIYQTYGPGAIVKVELVAAEDDQIIELPNSADPPGNTACPGVFTINVGEALPPVDAVIIHFDQTITGDWDEIDAVELVGVASGAAVIMPKPGQGEAEAALLNAVSCEIDAVNTVNTRSRPGTNYNQTGQLAAGSTTNANGWTTGEDGYVWWRLTNGSWVRNDVVAAAGDCESIIAAGPEDPMRLTERYITPEGYSVDYPQDWQLVMEHGGATIGNSQTAVERQFGEAFAPGEFQVSIRWTTLSALAPGVDFGSDPSPMDVLAGAITAAEGVDMDEPYELAIGDRVIAAAYGTFADVDGELSVVIWDAGSGIYGSVLTGSDLNGLEQFEPTLRAIIASALD